MVIYVMGTFSFEDDEIQGTLSDGAKVNLASGRDFTVDVFSMKIPVVVQDYWLDGYRCFPSGCASQSMPLMPIISLLISWALDGQFMHSDVSGITGRGLEM